MQEISDPLPLRIVQFVPVRHALRSESSDPEHKESAPQPAESPKCRLVLAGVWENWKDVARQEWGRTFCIVTTAANELVSEIHDRMPAIVRPEDYERWLSDEPDPRELLKPFPAKPMTTWSVSTRVNSPKNDDADLIAPAVQADARAPRYGNSA